MAIKKSFFPKPRVPLEGEKGSGTDTAAICPSCKNMIPLGEFRENLGVCPLCGFHTHVSGRQRIDVLADEGSFQELFGQRRSKNIIGFPGYEQKLAEAQERSAEPEAVVTGELCVDGYRAAVFSMNAGFMMGSMGTVVGDKIAALFEHAAEKRLPVVGFTVSGGARMQEGILSLMQMAKVSGAVRRHSDAGLFYLTVLTDPTAGGVTASFAMQGDIIISEPGALIAFAGPRVIEQTIFKSLPEGFQRAEFLMEHGFVDMITDRREMRGVISDLLRLHKGGGGNGCV